MDSLFMVRGMAGLLILVAAGTVLFARPAICWDSLVGLGFRASRLMGWHRLTGWLAVGGLLLAGRKPAQHQYQQGLSGGIEYHHAPLHK
jgi:hypothetical protein